MKYEDKPLPFGKHKGELICDVPASYLNWLLEQDWFAEKHKKLMDLVKIELKYRDDFGIKDEA